MAKKHTIVCGLGYKGTQLARELLDEGELVAVVECESEHPDVQEMREIGALVVIGDATHEHTLVRAGIDRACQLLITCGKDPVNVQVAAAAGDLCRERRSLSPLLAVHVHCTDQRLFDLLESQTSEDSFGPRADFRRFDTLLNGARRLFKEHPLDRLPISSDSACLVQLLLLGYSRESECMLLQTARLGIFANLVRPRIVIIDPEATTHEQKLRFRYPQIDHLCQLEFVSRHLEHPTTVTDVEHWIRDDNAISSVYVSPLDANQSIQIALGLPPILEERDVPVFLWLSEGGELVGLLKNATRRPRLLPVGLPAYSGGVSMVIQAELDAFAKAIHADWLDRRKKSGDTYKQYPAMCEWDQLSEKYRIANRDQADHISIKLRAVGCTTVHVKELQGRPPATFTVEELEIMSKMEHQRWNANRWLDGWRLGPRDETKKMHPNLVPWEDLDEATRDYDRDAVQKIPDLLKLVDQVIVRNA